MTNFVVMRRKAYTGIITLMLILFAEIAIGQCAMCGAVAEQASETNPGVGIGLNRGIIFLMAVPYTLFMIVGWVFFKKQIIQLFKRTFSFR